MGEVCGLRPVDLNDLTLETIWSVYEYSTASG